MRELIRVEDIEKYYGTKDNLTKALDRLSFQVDRGEFVGIMGASGSGKTTLLNVMATIDRVTSGHIWYGREDITALKEEQKADFRKNNLGFVFQDFNLLDTLTLGENISLALSLTGKGKKEIQQRTEDIMGRLGILELKDKFPFQVSGGQKQRCACARALINHPAIVFADEPTGALDSRSAGQILDIFTGLNRSGQTVLMVTHSLQAACRAGRVLFLQDGQMVRQLYRQGQTDDAFYQAVSQALTVLSAHGERGSVAHG